MTVFTGTSGTDTFAGADDIADRFDFAPADLSNSDTLHGGGGDAIDTLRLTASGDVTLTQLAGVSGIEQIEMFAGSSIQVTFAMLLTASPLVVVGSNGNDSVFGSAGTDATKSLSFTAGAGNDVFVGTRGDDVVSLVCDQLTAQDVFNGARGEDTLKIGRGGGLNTSALENMFGFETIALKQDGLNLVLSENTVSSTRNNTLTIKGSGLDDDVDATDVALGSSNVIFKGNDGNDFLEGGAGHDTLIGGRGVDFFHGNGGKDKAFGGEGDDILHGLEDSDKLDGGVGNDTIYGGAGADRITGGEGVDLLNISGGGATLIYSGVSESRSSSQDMIVLFDPLNDRFDLDVSVNGVDAGVSGTIDAASFDANVGSATASTLGSGHAVVVTASGGDMSGRKFLIVDANANGTYDGGSDYVMELQAAMNLGSLDTGNFI